MGTSVYVVEKRDSRGKFVDRWITESQSEAERIHREQQEDGCKCYCWNMCDGRTPGTSQE